MLDVDGWKERFDVKNTHNVQGGRPGHLYTFAATIDAGVAAKLTSTRGTREDCTYRGPARTIRTIGWVASQSLGQPEHLCTDDCTSN